MQDSASLISHGCCPAGSHLARAADPQPDGRFFGGDSESETYLVMPGEAQPVRGVVLVVHDIFGLHAGRHTQICDALAEAGYAAVCPDLFGDGRARAEAAFLPRWPIKGARNILELLCCCKLGWLAKAARTPWSAIEPAVHGALELARREHARLRPDEPPLAWCAALGFCWGVSTVARLLAADARAALPMPIRGGVGFHPAPLALALVSKAEAPLLLAPARNDPANLQPGGAVAEWLAARFGTPTSPAVVPFPTMLHGWMTRGPIEEEEIAAGYAHGLEITLGFLRERSGASSAS